MRCLICLSLALAVSLSRTLPAEDRLPDSKTVRVAGVVLKWIRTDKEANFRRAAKMIREAAKGGARIVCTTECFLDGYAWKPMEKSVSTRPS